MNIAIVGVTGLVGRKLLKLIDRRAFICSSIRLFASQRSAGTVLREDGHERTVEAIHEGMFEGIDIAFFAVDSDLSKKLAPQAVKAGAIVIDKSSAFRMDVDVPLVIPEINPEAIRDHKGIIASPNCSTTIMLMGLYPLHKYYAIKRIVVSTYQAMSGGGAGLLESFEDQIEAYAREKSKPDSTDSSAFTLFNNVIPDIGGCKLYGDSDEELKMAQESRKILGVPSLRISATCVRVPIARGHSMSVNVEFKSSEIARPDYAQYLIECFGNSNNSLRLIINSSPDNYPMPANTNEKEWCGIGRIRTDTTSHNGLVLWISGDNLWKGAALNALQIAEHLRK